MRSTSISCPKFIRNLTLVFIVRRETFKKKKKLKRDPYKIRQISFFRKSIAKSEKWLTFLI